MGPCKGCIRSRESRRSDVKGEWHHVNAKDGVCPQAAEAAESFPEWHHWCVLHYLLESPGCQQHRDSTGAARVPLGTLPHWCSGHYKSASTCCGWAVGWGLEPFSPLDQGPKGHLAGCHPPFHCPSQTLWTLICCTIWWMMRQKSNGPKGSPCWISASDIKMASL